MKIQNNIIKNIFNNVYFINGTAYAGKSTMVKLLAEKYDGICCGENYHSDLMELIDVENQPNLSYFKTMTSWQEFISRTPEEYDNWITGCSYEAADLEIVRLLQLADQGKKIFVDTNIPLEILTEISDYDHIAIMLSPQSMSIERFFDREDEEKKFLLEKIDEANDPEKALKNFKECLALINSPDKYKAFEESGFFTMVRTEDRRIEDAIEMLEKLFLL